MDGPLSGVVSQIWRLQKFRHYCFIMVLAPSCSSRAHILCTVHAGAKLWTHLARAAHEPTWEKTTFWIQISYNKSTCIRKLFEVAMRLKSEINPYENTFLGLLSIPGRKHACSKITLLFVPPMNCIKNSSLEQYVWCPCDFKIYKGVEFPFSRWFNSSENSIDYHVDLLSK